MEIPHQWLAQMASGNDRIPTLYYHPLSMARDFFWRRLRVIHDDIISVGPAKKRCLDFGCGGGVFLPTLSAIFDETLGLDLYPEDAQNVLKKYALSNVKLIGANAVEASFEAESFDAIVCADSLEHFQDPGAPLERIRRWLAPGGYLFTSLPTENFFTRLTRVLGNQEKPVDHYHSGAEVERLIEKAGFHKVRSRRLSWWFPLYLISVWRKNGSGPAS